MSKDSTDTNQGKNENTPDTTKKNKTRLTRRQFLVAGVGTAVVAAGAYAGYAYLVPKIFGSRGVSSKELTLVQISQDISMDPLTLHFTTDWGVAVNIYDSLVRYNSTTFDIEPDLATKWTTSSDGLTWTFDLRKGVNWHKNFGKFTATDVKFTYDRLLDPSQSHQWLSQLSMIKSTTVVDDYTIQFDLNYPYAPFINKVANYDWGFIVSEKAVQQYGSNYSQNPIGTGPFVFDHWVPSTELVLTANTDYWDGAPLLGKLSFVPITDTTSAFSALQSGQAQMMFDTDPTVWTQAQKAAGITTASKVDLGTAAIAFNTQMEPFTNSKVRQALAYATDLNAILQLQGGLGVAAPSVLGPGYLGATTNVTTYPLNVDTAKSMLADAGYSGGFTTTVYYPALPAEQNLFTLLQSNWSKVGVTLNLNPLQVPAWFAAVGKGQPPVSWLPISAYPPDPDFPLTAYFYSKSFPPGSNFMYYSGIDSLIEQGRTTTDQNQRAQIYVQAQQQISNDVPCIPYDHILDAYILSTKVSGFKPYLFTIYGPLKNVNLT